jgi:hypothetical protein
MAELAWHGVQCSQPLLLLQPLGWKSQDFHGPLLPPLPLALCEVQPRC